MTKFATLTAAALALVSGYVLLVTCMIQMLLVFALHFSVLNLYLHCSRRSSKRI